LKLSQDQFVSTKTKDRNWDEDSAMDSEVEKSEADSADHSSEMPDQELEDITEKEISIEPKAQEEQKTMSTNS
jgi:hypothetical protein